MLPGKAQAQSVTDKGDVGRLRYDYQRGIGERSRLFTVASYEQLISTPSVAGKGEKGSLRGGVSYNLKSWLRLEAGVGTYYTSRDVGEDLFEARLWQAATFDWPEVRALARWVVHHRFTLEERFQHSDGWDTTIRGRYRLSFTVPINRYTVEPGALYMPLSGEWFWNPGDDGSEVFTNRRTLLTGLGYQFDDDWAAEVRYTWQEQRGTITETFGRDDNIIELRVRSTIRILDYLKIR